MFNLPFLLNVKIKFYQRSLITHNNKYYFLQKQKKLFYKIYFAVLKHHNIKITHQHISIIALLYVIFDKPKSNKYLQIQNYAYAFGPKISYKIMSVFDDNNITEKLKLYLKSPNYKEENSILNTKILFGKTLFELLEIIIKESDKTETCESYIFSEIGSLLGLHLYLEMESMMFFYNKKKFEAISVHLIELMGWYKFSLIKRNLFDSLLINIRKLETNFNYLILLINQYSR